MGVKKILIFGNPHSGTSIIKSIVGHIDAVHEIYYECDKIEEGIYNKDYVVCKCPDVMDKFFEEEYKDYIKIFIVRNPIWVVASYKRRFVKDETKRTFKYSIERYVKVLEKFLECVKSPKNNLYTIRYEDIFENNFEKFKCLLNSIGLEYDPSIFGNENRNNMIVNGISYDKIVDMPKAHDHDRFRTYQINQAFVNNNTIEKLKDISHEEIKILLEQPAVIELYGDDIIKHEGFINHGCN